MISILRTQLCTPNLKEKLNIDEEKQIIRLPVISQLTEDGTIMWNCLVESSRNKNCEWNYLVESSS